jgi:hypothetical protein
MGKSKADKAREAKNARRRAAYAAKKDAESSKAKAPAKRKAKPSTKTARVSVKLRPAEPAPTPGHVPAGGFYEPSEGADDHRGLFDGA